METNCTIISEPCDDPSTMIGAVKNVGYTANNSVQSRNSISSKYLMQTNTSEYNNDDEETLMEASSMNEMHQSGDSERSTELCRVCANSSNHMISIFEGEGAQHDLCTKIHRYLPIRISENDTLPLYLCYHCASTLLAWHDLLEGCLDAEQKLLQMQAEFNSLEEVKFVSTIPEPVKADDTIKVVENAEPNVIEIQSLPETAIEAKDDVTEKTTTVIDERYQTAETIGIDHLNNERPNDKKCGQYETTLRKTNVSYCDINNENEPTGRLQGSRAGSYNRIAQRNKRINNSENVEISQLKSIGNVRQFRDITQSNSNEIDKDSELELINKAKTVMKDKVIYHCDRCNKQLLTRRGYIRHIRIHSGNRPCVCAKCDKTFIIKQDLIRHMNDVHEGLKKYVCDICDRAFANKNARDDHRRIHTGEKPYTCDQCQKTFRTLNSLYVHNRGHTNYKPHQCTTCRKYFRNKQRLNNHMTTHTGVKAFPCEICGKTFSVKSEAVRHRNIHNTGKPFACTICSMKFGQKRYLRNHYKVHHEAQSKEMLARLNVELN